MFLSRIILTNYKSHTFSDFNFSKKINCLIGKNGIGKTNVLDAIHYLCLTKSYFNHSDLQIVKQDEVFFRLESSFSIQNTPQQLVSKYANGKKKEFLLNDIPYKRLADHIGKFPIIMVAPDDAEIINGGSEERRRFLDITLSQINQTYLTHLILYQKLLEQRNAHLKNLAEQNIRTSTLLETYNLQMIPLAEMIFRERQKAIVKITQSFEYFYNLLAQNKEKVSINYISQLENQDLALLLRGSLQKDLALERTCVGIHKDELEFILNGNKIKRFGSQGQLKTFILALKFAQYEFIQNHKGFKPILIIDDIFDKLDGERSTNLLHLLSTDLFGQIFISNTQESNILDVFKESPQICEIIKINETV